MDKSIVTPVQAINGLGDECLAQRCSSRFRFGTIWVLSQQAKCMHWGIVMLE